MATDDTTKHVTPAQGVISPTKRKQLQQCFEKANDLRKKPKPDFDYAHDLYSQCVVSDPGNLVYVEAMLDNLQKKYGNNKKGSRFSGFASRKGLLSAVEEEDWTEVFREGLDLLKANPWDVVTLRELARACAFNRFNEVELRYLKNALDGKPTDPEVNRHCAQSLARMGQFDMAISCWTRVQEKNRKSDEPQRMISELTMAKTMGAALSPEALGQVGPRRAAAPTPEVSGEEGASEVASDAERDVGTPSGGDANTRSNDTDSSESDKSGRREIKLNARQVLERAIKENPSQAENYLKLAEVHTAERRYHDAEQVLEKAIAAVGASLQFQTALEDARMRSARARVAIAEKRAAGSKSEEAIELVNKLRDDLNRLELDVYQQRSQRFPEKKRFHFELGLRLRRAGNFLEAIKSYDQARQDPASKGIATLEMGECWQQLKQYSKSLKCYQAVIEGGPDLEREHRHLALYRGGVLAAALKQTDDAVNWLGKLVEEDPAYRDAASRLDKLRRIGQDS